MDFAGLIWCWFQITVGCSNIKNKEGKGLAAGKSQPWGEGLGVGVDKKLLHGSQLCIGSPETSPVLG